MDSFTLRIPTAAQDCSSRARPASPSNTKYCTVTFHTSSKNTESCFRRRWKHKRGGRLFSSHNHRKCRLIGTLQKRQSSAGRCSWRSFMLEQRKAAFLIRNILQLMMLHTLVKCRSLTFAKRYEPPHHHATLRASASAPPLHDETSCNARDLCATTVYYPAHDVGSAASGDAHDQSWRTLATHGRAPAGDGGDPAGVGRRCATAVAAAGGARLRSDV
jgi:hypothetical protein